MNKVEKLTWEWILDEHPKAIGVEWSFYGGGFLSEKNSEIKINKSDVNWEDTRPLTSESESSFTDTFHEPENIDVLVGTLVLKSGKKLSVGLELNHIDMLNDVLSYTIERMEL